MKRRKKPSKGLHMIRYTSEKQIPLEGFVLPFGGRLNPENRWVKLGQRIPWDELAQGYYKQMSAGHGRPAKNARLVIGAVIIKHKMNLSDEETVLQIQENPYLQYFVGLPKYQDEPAFAASLFVEVRRRMGAEVFEAFEKAILKEISKVKRGKDSNDKEDPPQHKGKLVIDATVADQNIRFPTDIGLLNESREITEELIDELSRENQERKPRTYRRQARKNYLQMAKNKRPGKDLLRKGIRQQLQYLKRNLGHIDRLLNSCSEFPLSFRQQKQLWVVREVFCQQSLMYKNRSHRCDDRIVSVHQPHVRPIVRGKAGSQTEFGSKISVSLVDGIARVDHLSWDAFNESHDLEEQVEKYKTRYGYYPEAVLADGIYGTRANRKYLQEKGIRFGGRPLGRPPKQTDQNAEHLKRLRKQSRQDVLDRIPIEGKFGQGKNGYRLNRILARTARTSESWINAIFLVMNLLVLLRLWCVQKLSRILGVLTDCLGSLWNKNPYFSDWSYIPLERHCGAGMTF
jgi:IS5 family transposase